MVPRQGRNHGKMLAATFAMVGKICPLWDRVKLSENIVTPVAPVVTPLLGTLFMSYKCSTLLEFLFIMY